MVVARIGVVPSGRLVGRQETGRGWRVHARGTVGETAGAYIVDRTDERADLPGSEAKVKSSSWMADAEQSDWTHIHSAAEMADQPEVRVAGRD